MLSATKFTLERSEGHLAPERIVILSAAKDLVAPMTRNARSRSTSLRPSVYPLSHPLTGDAPNNLSRRDPRPATRDPRIWR
jgi:hypothetical protein